MPAEVNTKLDSKRIATKILKGASKMLLQDMQALPTEAFEKDFGGKSRNIADFMYEVNLVNDHVGMVIRGEKPFEWPSEPLIKAPKDFRGKDKIIAAFEKSSTKIIETVEGFTPAQLEETIKIEDGETTRFERCQFMALHMWYHSGQLNYIQTLLGDDGWHWN